MKNLNISVVNKVATYRQRDGFIVCGNSGSRSGYQITFDFDSEWNYYPNKTARFKWNGGFRDVAIVDNIAEVPLITDAEMVEVGVYADATSTTTPAQIPCKKSIKCGSGNEYLTAEDFSNTEAKLLAACRLFRHSYDITAGTVGDKWVELKFTLYSKSLDTLQDRSDFLNHLSQATYQTLFDAWLGDSPDFRRDGYRVEIADGKIEIYYKKVASGETGLLTLSTFSVTNYTIMEA